MAVPNIFGSATSAIPLSQLDQNFATAITLGNTAVYLGNTTTSLGNVTLTNVTISSGNVSVSTATVGAGSNTAPSITTTGDTNTGIFFPAADTIAFSEGGVETMRLDSAGNMGLGVTPSAWALSGSTALQIRNAGFVGYLNNAYVTANTYFDSVGGARYIASANASYYAQTSGQHQWFTAASGTAGAAISLTQAMTLDASGNLLLNTTGSPAASAKMKIATSARTGAFFDLTATGGENWIIDSTNTSGSTDVLGIYASGATGMYLTDTGNLLVGTTDSSVTSGTGFKVRDTAQTVSVVTAATTNGGLSTYLLYSSGASAYRFYVGAGGTVFATSTTISAISDIRYKENVRDLNVGLAEVMALKPRLYDWKEGKGADIKNARGFIAQEFEEVFPDLIDEWKDPAPEGEDPYKSVRADLIPVLVKAIQELKADLDATKAELAALKGTA